MFLGDSAVPFFAYIRELQVRNPDVFFEEFTPDSDLHLMVYMEVFGSTHVVMRELLCPSQVGIPTTRMRSFIFGIRKSFLADTWQAPSPKSIFGRHVVGDWRFFFCADADSLKFEFRRLSHEYSKTDASDWVSLMSPAHQRRIAEGAELIASGFWNDDGVDNIAVTCLFKGRLSKLAPCLTTSSVVLWSHAYTRPQIGLERLVQMGFPAFPWLERAQKMELPMAAILPIISNHNINHVTGNGVHVIVFAAVALSAFSVTELPSTQ